MERAALIDLLKNNVCVVTFTKVNGETREMPCTLLESVLPKKVDNIETIKKENPNVISVWCTDKNAWRSFRVDNVVNVKVNE